MLIDNSIMKAFGTKLDLGDERLSFQDSNVTIPATHIRRPIKSNHYLVITQTFAMTEKVFLYGFLRNRLFQPHMKHSYVFSVRHDLKKIR